MKTLLVLLIFAGFVFAQHTDVVNQTGDYNDAYVDQGFMSSPGPGLPGNEAFVDQIGHRNYADVDQYNGGFAGDGHYANVLSQGNDNYAKVFQERAAGDADVYQLGSNNWTEVFQSGNFGTSTNFTPGIDAHAYSIGNYNVIVEKVWGTDATAYSHQIGDYNRIDQLMGSDYGQKVQNSDFEATQVGHRNTAYQKMDGQGFAGGITAVNNFGSIYTQGNDNYALQVMNENAVAAANNTATAYQLGSNNWSEQWQTGAGNNSAHTQVGNYDVAVTNQN